jgi:hypothetical protein
MMWYSGATPLLGFGPSSVGLFTGSAFLFYGETMLVLLRVPDIIDDDAASDELDELCDYIEQRLTAGVSDRRVFQSLMEAVLSFEGDGIDKTEHVLH